jgi:hypothetical protein
MQVRKYLTVAAVIPILLLSHFEAKSLSTGEVFAACTSTDKTAETMCAIYMTGFMNGITFDQITRGDGPNKICMPKGITGNDVKVIFEKFMRDNPKLQNETKLDQPAVVVGMALFQAYPCPGAIK